MARRSILNLGVPDYAGQIFQLAQRLATVELRNSQLVSAQAQYDARLAALEAGGTPTPTPTPAPAFTQQPTISPTSGTAGTTTFTATSGVVTGGSITSRVWLLNGTSISTGLTATPQAAGTLTYQETATGGGQAAQSNVISATVAVDNGGGTPTPSGPINMPLGMNVAGLQRYTENTAFIDHLKVAEVGTTNGQQDSRGWPTALGTDGNGTPVYTFVGMGIPDGRTTPVDMILYTDGDFDVRMSNPQAGYSKTLTKVADGYAFTHTSYGSAKYGAQEYINFLEFSAIRTPAAQHFALVRADQLALYKAGKVFQPAFTADLKRFPWYRDLNWCGGNDPVYANVAVDYVSYITQGENPNRIYRNVPFAVRAKFCEESGISPWFILHHTITDAQFQAMWPTFDRLKAAGLPVRLEFTNEGWNTSFPQRDYLNQKALDHGYVDPDYGNFFASVWEVGRRTAELAKLSRGRGYVWEGGGQPANPFTTDIFYQGYESVSGHDLADLTHLTFNHYFYGTLGIDPNRIGATQNALQKQWAIDANYTAAFDNLAHYVGPESGSITAVKTRAVQVVAKAAAKGHTVETYEGNQHISWSPHMSAAGDRQADKGFFDAIRRHAYMRELNLIMLKALQDAGVKGATAFDYNSMETNTDSGDFGYKDKPAYQALIDWTYAYTNSSDLEIPPLESGGGTPTPTPSTIYTRMVIDETAGSSNGDFNRMVFPQGREIGFYGKTSGTRLACTWNGPDDTKDHSQRYDLPMLYNGVDTDAWQAPGIYEIGSIVLTGTVQATSINDLASFFWVANLAGLAPGKFRLYASTTALSPIGTDGTLLVDFNESTANNAWADNTERRFTL